MTERFPVDSEVTGKDRRGEEDEDAREERRFNEWAKAVLELAETLGPIDPVPVGEFWQTFLSNVSQGLYASDGSWLDRPDDRGAILTSHPG